jgi:hypothetical protein
MDKASGTWKNLDTALMYYENCGARLTENIRLEDSLRQLAVKWVNITVSHNLLGMSEEAQINADDLSSATLLARDERGKAAWQMSVIDGRMQKLIDWQNKCKKYR